jgi:hypothetical protein
VRVVIDCNVLIAANRRETTASLACSAACARRLLDAADNDVLLEDTTNLIWGEYKRYCSFSGQPGPGDRFFVWLVRNRWTPERVHRIDIGADDDEIEAHVPSALRDFDRSDRKWIVTYIGGVGEALYNALDSDWSESTKDLSDAGINVVELCPQDLRHLLSVRFDGKL